MKYIIGMLSIGLLFTNLAQAAPKPNVILIMVDDMGWSDIGCYGSEIQTPNIDSLAANGIRFREFYNTSKCFPTRACLMSGVYAHQNGFDNGNGNYLRNCTTLGEVHRSAGYHTYMSGKNHGLDNLYNRGFDHYYGLRDGACNHFNPGLQRAGEPAPANKGRSREWVDDSLLFVTTNPAYQSYFPTTFYTTDAFTSNAQDCLTEWETQNTGDPFFMYISYTAPHDPMMAWPADIAKYAGVYDVGYDTIRNARYQKQLTEGLVNPTQYALSPSTHQDWSGLDQSTKDDQARRMQVYAAMIDRVDQKIGELINQLQVMGVYNDTLILFCSDNGASAANVDKGDPNAQIGGLDRWASLQGHWANVSNTPFSYFKNDSEEGGIRTPMIAHWPNGIVNPGRFTDKRGHMIDFMATLVELAGAEYPRFYGGTGVVPMQGNSFTDVLFDQAIVPHSPLFFEWKSGRAVMDGDYKLVSRNNGSTWKLYDMTVDATELNDLSASQPTIKANLLAQFNTWFAAVNNNELPTAYDDTVQATFPTPINIDVLGNDTDSDGTVDASTLVITRNPTNGSVSINPDHTVLYTPGATEVPSVDFAYQVKDNDGELSNEGVVTVHFEEIPEPPASMIWDSSLLLWWKLNDGAGLIATDASGNMHDGNITGPSWFNPGYNGSGECLSHNGISDTVTDLDAELFLNGLNAITVSMWIKSDLTGTDKGFLDTEAPDNKDDTIMIRYDVNGANGGGTNVIKAGMSTTGGFTNIESSSGVQTTSWQHIALTWSSGNSLTLFINGVQDLLSASGVARTGTVNNVVHLMVGKGSKDSSGSWDGLIDDLRIYNRVLSSTEIGYLASVETTAPLAPTSLAATANRSGAALDWAANSEPDNWFYTVYRSENSGGVYAYLNNTLNIDYTDSTAVNGTRYYYVVTASDVSGNQSANSNEDDIILYEGDITFDGIVDMQDMAELGSQWQSGYDLTTLQAIAADWLSNQGI